MKHAPKIIVLLMALIPLAPPWFIQGGVFDALEVQHGEVVHGKYLDNITSIVKYLNLTILFLFFPYIVRFSLPPFYVFLSNLLSVWFLAQFVFETYHFNMSFQETLNLQDKSFYDIFAIVFALGVLLFKIFEEWKEQKLS